MCVIIVKKQGVQTPSQSILNQAYRANSHGCGFAVKKADGTFYMYKTLNFKKFCKKVFANVAIEDDAIFHFRLATHGSICKDNCHPFSTEDGRLFFAHNGVLPIESENNQTDSEIIFNRLLAPAVGLFGLRSKTFANIVDSVIGGSKFAFLDEHGIKTFGNFETVNDLLFSNLRGFYELKYGINPYQSTSYRNDDFYADLFAEHNKAYKTPKYSWQF